MTARLDAGALDQLFLDARTHRAWQPREVPDSLLKEMVDLMKMGPTASNCQPARIVFVKSKEAKERLKPHLSEGNRDKTMAAPVCAIIGLRPEVLRASAQGHAAAGRFAGKADRIQAATLRNGSLQGAYLIMAARALGLDAGRCRASTMPASTRSSSPARTSDRIFSATSATATASGMRPRGPRFAFGEMAQIL